MLYFTYVTLYLYYISGICYFVPVVGGWVADSVAGRYNTIYGSGLIYLIGQIHDSRGDMGTS